MGGERRKIRSSTSRQHPFPTHNIPAKSVTAVVRIAHSTRSLIIFHQPKSCSFVQSRRTCTPKSQQPTTNRNRLTASPAHT